MKIYIRWSCSPRRKKRIPDREYYAGQHKREKFKTSVIENNGDGPQITNFQTQKQFLRDAVEDAARLAHDTKEFQKILLEKHNVVMKESRGRFSYLHPERKKFITGRSLGTLYDTAAVLEMIADKEKIPKRDTKEKSERQQTDEPTMEQNRNQDIEHPAAAFGNSENRPAESNGIPQKRPDAIRRMPDKNGSDELAQDSVSVLFFRSELRLVIDLQSCIKAQQSQAYARKLKITNLKRMAETLAYIQERGYDTREILEDELSGAKAKTTASRKSLKETETRLKEVNEQIHYTGQYLANKSVYTQFLKSKNKGKFRQEHTAEITLYETASKFLKEKLAKDAPDGKASGKLPSLKLLKEEKEKLLQEKESRQDVYRQDRDRQKELDTVCSNVDAILGQPTRQVQREISGR